MRIITLIALSIAVVSISLLICADTSSASEAVPDGSEYTYSTYGTSHPDYYCEITRAVSDEDVLHIPTVLEGYDVRIISSGAFDGSPANTIIVPVNVYTIASEAFTVCPYLTDVYFLGDRPEMDGAFPAGVTMHYLPGKTGWGVPYVETECTTLNGITYAKYPDGWMAISGTPTDGKITIVPEIAGVKVSSLAPYSFAGIMQPSGEVERRTDIVSMELGAGITDIRERAFYYCDIQNVSIPESLTAIHDEAFRAAYHLSTVPIQDGLRYIGFECFRDCHSLEHISIPDSVRFLGDGAFYICKSAEDITIGSGITSVPVRGFGYCSSLVSIDFSRNAETIAEAAFMNCTSLKEVKLPESIKTVGDGAFKNCSDLNSLSLGNAISLGREAFRDCTSLASFDLPSTVESLGRYCFADCTGLRDIYAYGRCPSLDDTVFLNDPVTVHCSKDNYDSWNNSQADAAIKDDLNKKAFNPLYIVLPIVAVFAGGMIIWRYSKKN